MPYPILIQILDGLRLRWTFRRRRNRRRRDVVLAFDDRHRRRRDDDDDEDKREISHLGGELNVVTGWE